MSALLGLVIAGLAWSAVRNGLTAHRIYAIAAAISICMVVGVAIWLRAALHSAEKNTAEVMDAFVRARNEIEDLDQSYRKRLHDARSAASSVQCAVQLLNQRPHGKPVDGRQLLRLMSAEIQRMQTLLDLSTEPLVDFDLPGALEPVILAHRIGGTRIRCSLAPVHVQARPYATASALDNVLRNASVHAPDAEVEIRLVIDDQFATVVVEDNGPGIPLDECRKVLLPGVRGSEVTGPGSGLGLHTASSAILDQSGTLRVMPRPGRGTRVEFTIPLASVQPNRLAPIQSLAS